MRNMDTVNHLERLLREYEAAKRLFDDVKLKSGTSNVSPQEIIASIDVLYQLKHTGKKIRELFDGQSKARKKEYKNTEYVHKSIPIKTDTKEHKSEIKKSKGSDKDEKKSKGSDRDQNKYQNRG